MIGTSVLYLIQSGARAVGLMVTRPTTNTSCWTEWRITASGTSTQSITGGIIT